MANSAPNIGPTFSDTTYNAAVSSGQWLVMERGDVIAPNDERLARNSDGTWTINYSNGAANVGFVVGLHPQIRNGVAGFVQSVEADVVNAVSAVGTALSAAENAVESAWSDLETAVSDVEGFISSLPSEVISVWKDILTILSKLVTEFGVELDGLEQLGQFVLSISGNLISVLDPGITGTTRQAALDHLNPFKEGSAVYQFITSPNYAVPRRLLAIIIAAPFCAIFGYAIFDVLLSTVSPQLAQFLSPANSIDVIISAISTIVTGIAKQQNVFTVIENTVNALLTYVGITCSPACLVKITYKVLLGLPIPPVADIIVTLLNDPVAQKSLATLLDISKLTTILPVAMACFDAADSGSWLSCFQSLIEAIFPNVIAGLQKFSIDINDIRVLIDGIWQTGGDFTLMLQSKVLNAASASSSFGDINQVVQFVKTTELTPIQAAIISIGFFGVDFVANVLLKSGGNINASTADNFFETLIVPALPDDVQQDVQISLDVFHLLEQILLDHNSISARINFKTVPVGYALYLLESFHDAKWDVQLALQGILLDELSGSSQKFFTDNLAKLSTGAIQVTSTLKSLFSKLLADFPKLKFLLDGLAQKLGLKSATDLFYVDSASENASIQAAGGTAQVHSVVSLPQQARSAPPPNSSSQSVPNSSSQSKATSQPSAKINWAAVGAGAGTGALIGGGVPGVLVGAAAALLLKKKES